MVAIGDLSNSNFSRAVGISYIPFKFAATENSVVCPSTVHIDHTVFSWVVGSCMPVICFRFYMLDMRKEQNSQKSVTVFQ